MNIDQADRKEIVWAKDAEIHGDKASCCFEYAGKTQEFFIQSESLCRETIPYAWLIVAFMLACIYNKKLIRFSPTIFTRTGKDPDTSKLSKVLQLWREWFPQYNLPEEIEYIFEQVKICDLVTREGALFYSGGVDSTFALQHHKDEIDAFIVVQGFDIPLVHEKYFKETISNIRPVAEHENKRIITAKTNIFDECPDLNNHWASITQAAALSTISHALGMRKTIIGSGFAYKDYHPWGASGYSGAHPDTDKLFSSDYTEIEHDVCKNRTDKLVDISKNDFYIEHLRVCVKSRDRLNCSRCYKCIRTMAVLDILGKRPPSFDWSNWSPNSIGKSYFDDIDLIYFTEIKELAQKNGREDIIVNIEKAEKRKKRLAWVKIIESTLKKVIYKLMPSIKYKRSAYKLKKKIYAALGINVH